MYFGIQKSLTERERKRLTDPDESPLPPGRGLWHMYVPSFVQQMRFAFILSPYVVPGLRF